MDSLAVVEGYLSCRYVETSLANKNFNDSQDLAHCVSLENSIYVGLSSESSATHSYPP